MQASTINLSKPVDIGALQGLLGSLQPRECPPANRDPLRMISAR